MNSLILLIATGQLLLAAAIPTISETGRGNGSTNLVNLGSVDGKSFFFDTTAMDWTAAQAYCNSLGLQLAEITTDSQVDFLKSKYGVQGFTNWFWLGGRDARLPRALSWDSIDSELGFGLTGITWRYVPVDSNFLCTIYGSLSVPKFEINKCTGLINIKPLCETLH